MGDSLSYLDNLLTTYYINIIIDIATGALRKP